MFATEAPWYAVHLGPAEWDASGHSGAVVVVNLPVRLLDTAERGDRAGCILRATGREVSDDCIACFATACQRTLHTSLLRLGSYPLVTFARSAHTSSAPAHSPEACIELCQRGAPR